jgi:hypothetical protein
MYAPPSAEAGAGPSVTVPTRTITLPSQRRVRMRSLLGLGSESKTAPPHPKFPGTFEVSGE